MANHYCLILVCYFYTSVQLIKCFPTTTLSQRTGIPDVLNDANFNATKIVNLFILKMTIKRTMRMDSQ